jgi:RNA polymerase sigma-70 factor (ECF subfamily)
MSADEKQLIEGCLSGDRKAQQALYDRFSRRMMGLCLRYVRNAEDARDLLQEGFIKVFTNLARYSGEGVFDGWVRKIFVNCALEHLRRKDVLRETADIEIVDTEAIADAGDEEGLNSITEEQLMRYISKLPDGFRTVFNLFAVEGYSHSEIASELKIKESTSRSQYMRARVQLQKMILENL